MTQALFTRENLPYPSARFLASLHRHTPLRVLVRLRYTKSSVFYPLVPVLFLKAVQNPFAANIPRRLSDPTMTPIPFAIPFLAPFDITTSESRRWKITGVFAHFLPRLPVATPAPMLVTTKLIFPTLLVLALYVVSTLLAPPTATGVVDSIEVGEQVTKARQFLHG